MNDMVVRSEEFLRGEANAAFDKLLDEMAKFTPSSKTKQYEDLHIRLIAQIYFEEWQRYGKVPLLSAILDTLSDYAYDANIELLNTYLSEFGIYEIAIYYIEEVKNEGENPNDYVDIPDIYDREHLNQFIKNNDLEDIFTEMFWDEMEFNDYVSPVEHIDYQYVLYILCSQGLMVNILPSFFGKAEIESMLYYRNILYIPFATAQGILDPQLAFDTMGLLSGNETLPNIRYLSE